ncbi:Rpn family recombination-promoting nuclease/putative transposase [Enterobacteriales bacterium SAP-6]|uniref:Rpn family recombination-promoting nuclease/putative transposase n=2 Tax=Acerihabitans arboris TaxID=2691583 RepID=A0A845SMQ4_9GAMM|nr:Rpn family recombination-promoting nuclease/putative transposase [Acerihabitans arboris]
MDKLMAFRLMRYSVAAMQYHLEQGHKHVPLVIPLLFYHGRKGPYPYSTRWLDCFADPETAESVYFNPFSLVDVTVISDETLLGHRRIALMEMVQKHIFVRNWMDKVCDIAALMQNWPITKAQFNSFVYYIDHTGKRSIKTQLFLTTLARQAPRYKGNIMTLVEQLERKGMRKGFRKGKEVARTLLAKGVERTIIAATTGFSEKKLTAFEVTGATDATL